MKKRLKINGIIMFLAFLAMAAFPGFFFRGRINGILNIIAVSFGMAFILLGQFLRTASRGYKAEGSGEGTRLIQSGPYELVRNPMYLGILLIGIGFVLIFFKWWVAAIFIAVFIIRYILLIFEEEKKLVKVFPGEYERYLRITPRLFPSPAVLFKKEISEYLPMKLFWLKKESGTIFGISLFFIVVVIWQAYRCYGVRPYLKEIMAASCVLVLFIFLAAYLIKRTKSVSIKGKNSLQ